MVVILLASRLIRLAKLGCYAVEVSGSPGAEKKKP